MPNPGLTNVQKKIMDVLSDGMAHLDEELLLCLSDDLGTMANVRPHLTDLRKKLRPRGRDIVCERYNGGNTYYRQVRHLRDDEV